MKNLNFKQFHFVYKLKKDKIQNVWSESNLYKQQYWNNKNFILYAVTSVSHDSNNTVVLS